MRPLRLLGLTNLYPPDARGGYGEICADVMEGLASRGHSVRMLVCGEAPTDLRSGGPGRPDGVEVRRELAYVLAPWRRPLRGLRAVAHDQSVVVKALAAGADVALIWHMRGVMKTSLRLLHEAGIPVLYMLHDRWVLYERAGPWLVPWPVADRVGFTALRDAAGRFGSARVELRSPPIEREGVVCFVSNWLRQEYARLGWRPRDARVVPCGVAVERIRSLRMHPPEPPFSRLLFAGRVHPSKGLQVGVEALARAGEPFRLTVAGPEDDPRYLSRVRTLAGALGVSDRIDWRGEVSRSEVLRLLGEHDVLLYPSVAPEAYSLGLLEALAAGALILTSAVGGPREYLEGGRNALLFDPGDAETLAGHLTRVASDRALAGSLLEGAHATADTMSIESILDQVEGIIAEVVR